MKAPRSYQQFCGLALALDRVGERWALLVVRELLAGPKRFADLLEGMPGVATNTLTSRLEELEGGGLIERQRLPPPAASFVYQLTPRGRELEPTVLAFTRWGKGEIERLQGEPKRAAALAPLRSTSLGLALKAFFRSPGRKVSGRLQLQVRTGTLGLAVKAGELELTYAALLEPEATLTTDEMVVIALMAGQLGLAAARKSGALELEGDAEVAQRVLGCFLLAEAPDAG